MWFRIMLPGLGIGFLVLTFWLVLALNPGQTFPSSVASGLLGLGILVTGVAWVFIAIWEVRARSR
jgi:hypothetical protein